jgi:hypothetical protein
MKEEEKRAIKLFQNHRDQEGNEAWLKHYLYVDRASDAKRLRKQLTDDGFDVIVRPSAADAKWLILVRHRASVEEGSVETFRSLLESIVTKAKGGEYDS